MLGAVTLDLGGSPSSAFAIPNVSGLAPLTLPETLVGGDRKPLSEPSPEAVRLFQAAMNAPAAENQEAEVQKAEDRKAEGLEADGQKVISQKVEGHVEEHRKVEGQKSISVRDMVSYAFGEEIPRREIVSIAVEIPHQALAPQREAAPAPALQTSEAQGAKLPGREAPNLQTSTPPSAVPVAAPALTPQRETAPAPALQTSEAQGAKLPGREAANLQTSIPPAAPSVIAPVVAPVAEASATFNREVAPAPALQTSEAQGAKLPGREAPNLQASIPSTPPAAPTVTPVIAPVVAPVAEEPVTPVETPVAETLVRPVAILPAPIAEAKVVEAPVATPPFNSLVAPPFTQATSVIEKPATPATPVAATVVDVPVMPVAVPVAVPVVEEPVTPVAVPFAAPITKEPVATPIAAETPRRAADPQSVVVETVVRHEAMDEGGEVKTIDAPRISRPGPQTPFTPQRETTHVVTEASPVASQVIRDVATPAAQAAPVVDRPTMPTAPFAAPVVEVPVTPVAASVSAPVADGPVRPVAVPVAVPVVEEPVTPVAAPMAAPVVEEPVTPVAVPFAAPITKEPVATPIAAETPRRAAEPHGVVVETVVRHQTLDEGGEFETIETSRVSRPVPQTPFTPQRETTHVVTEASPVAAQVIRDVATPAAQAAPVVDRPTMPTAPFAAPVVEVPVTPVAASVAAPVADGPVRPVAIPVAAPVVEEPVTPVAAPMAAPLAEEPAPTPVAAESPRLDPMPQREAVPAPALQTSEAQGAKLPGREAPNFQTSTSTAPLRDVAPAATKAPEEQETVLQAAPVVVAPPEQLNAAAPMREDGISVSAATARTEAIVETVSKMVEAVVGQIAITPSLVNGEGEVRMTLKPTVLDGSDITLTSKDGTLAVAIAPATPEAAQAAAAALPRLEAALAEHVSAFHHVSVALVAKKGKIDETA